MKRVTGSGGIFFKSETSEALFRWCETHLGIQRDLVNGAHSFGGLRALAWIEGNRIENRLKDYYERV